MANGLNKKIQVILLLNLCVLCKNFCQRELIGVFRTPFQVVQLCLQNLFVIKLSEEQVQKYIICATVILNQGLTEGWLQHFSDIFQQLMVTAVEWPLVSQKVQVTAVNMIELQSIEIATVLEDRASLQRVELQSTPLGREYWNADTGCIAEPGGTTSL